VIPTLPEIARQIDACGSLRRWRFDGIRASRAIDRALVGATGIPKQSTSWEERQMTFINGNWYRVFPRLIFLVFLLARVAAATAAEPGARLVKYSKEDIVPVHAKLRFSTLIVLPDEEEILDFTTGDREFWIINGSHNLCYVHPAQAGIRSNLNLITASGHVYSFLLTEIGSDSTVQPDLKLFIEPKEGSAIGTVLRGYVHAADAEAYKKEMADLRQQAAEQVRNAQAHAAEEINQFRSAYATKLHFDYQFDPKASREPFLVLAIYHDDLFTYIRSAARDKPIFYELKDGKPNLVSFQLENGVYIVPKVVDAGYLAIGKKKLNFARQSAAK
jgi:type IV secretion system protein VirB9